MKIREATAADRARLRELYTAFFAEQPAPSWLPVHLEHELGEVEEYIDLEERIALAAEDDGAVVGFALGRIEQPGIGHLSDIYVVPDARRQGAASELVRELAGRLREQGATVLRLHVAIDNPGARSTYERLGFESEQLLLIARIEELLRRPKNAGGGPTFGSVHVQLDDERAVEQAVRKYVPRLGRSSGSVVSRPRNGWIAVYDELCEGDPKALRRLASELSNATGAVTVAIGLEEGTVVRYLLFDRGSVVDEYLSVPEFFGPLPPGDAIALQANPTVVARLTGASPAQVRAVAKTAAAPDELPPAQELLAAIAALLGLEGAEHGFGEAEASGGILVRHR